MSDSSMPGDAVDALRLQMMRLKDLQEQIASLQELRSELEGAREKLGRQLAFYESEMNQWEWFFEHSIDMLCIAGFDGCFKRVNLAFEKILGYSREELLARPFFDFVHPDDLTRTHTELAALGAGCDSVNFENRYRHKDGTWRWILWTCPAAESAKDNLYAIARDITNEKRSAEEILFMAQHDPLTGLGNRALFDQAVAEALARTERVPSHEVALMLLDLDGFKGVNDRYGHRAGDHVLRSVAQRLRKQQRRIDVACRFGGDEFALILEGNAPIPLERLAGKLLKLVCEPIEWADHSIQICCSIGLATFPRPAENGSDLVAQADMAMYAAKQGGKNRYARYEKETMEQA